MKLTIKKINDNNFEADLSVSELLKNIKNSEYLTELIERYEVLYALNQKLEDEIYSLRKLIKKFFAILEISISILTLINIIQWVTN